MAADLDGQRLLTSRCPFGTAAADHPDVVCSLDRGVVSGLFGELAKHHAEIYGAPGIAGDDPGRGFEPYLADPRLKHFWVAEAEGIVAGCAGLMVEPDGAMIEPVIVASTHRRRNIGTALIHRAEAQAKKDGIRFLSIKPVARNIDAFRLYVALGYDRVGEIELFRDLSGSTEREWKHNLVIHDHELGY